MSNRGYLNEEEIELLRETRLSLLAPIGREITAQASSTLQNVNSDMRLREVHNISDLAFEICHSLALSEVQQRRDEKEMMAEGKGVWLSDDGIQPEDLEYYEE